MVFLFRNVSIASITSLKATRIVESFEDDVAGIYRADCADNNALALIMFPALWGTRPNATKSSRRAISLLTAPRLALISRVSRMMSNSDEAGCPTKRLAHMTE